MKGGGSELQVQAHLVREPTNRFDRCAVQVVVDGHHVGYLPADASPAYAPVVDQLVASGLQPRVAARVWAGLSQESDWDDRGRERVVEHVRGSVSLSLNAPHLLVPLNPAPTGRCESLPEGRKLKVTLAPGAMTALRPWLQVQPEGWLHLTLHSLTEHLARSSREIIEARLDGVVVGRLTPVSSKHFLSVVGLLTERGVTCGARGLVRGNQVEADLSLVAARSSDLTDEWLAEHVFRHAGGAGTDTAEPSRGPDQSSTYDSGAGWREDPDQAEAVRWWDGTGWTSRIKMKPADWQP